MAGQPVRGPRDAEEFRKQHLATLDVMIANNDKNLQANLLHKRTGQIASQITDYRTTSEKLADITALKIDIRRQLRRICDAPNAEQIASQLSGDDVRFLSQHIEQVIKEIQPKFRYGIDAPHFMAYFRKLQFAETEASGVPSNTLTSRQFSIEDTEDILISLPSREQLRELLDLLPAESEREIAPVVGAYDEVFRLLIDIREGFNMNIPPIKAKQLMKIVKETTKDLLTKMYLSQVLVKLADIRGDDRATRRLVAELNNSMGGRREMDLTLRSLDKVRQEMADILREVAEEERRFADEQLAQEEAERNTAEGLQQEREEAEARRQAEREGRIEDTEGFEAGDLERFEAEEIARRKLTKSPTLQKGVAKLVGEKRAKKEKAFNKLTKSTTLRKGVERRAKQLRERDELPDLDEEGGYRRGKSFYEDPLSDFPGEGGAEETKEEPVSSKKKGRPIKQRPLPDEPLPRPDELEARGRSEYTSAKINTLLQPYKKEIAKAGLPTLKQYTAGKGGARSNAETALEYYDSIYTDLQTLRALRKTEEVEVSQERKKAEKKQSPPVVNWRGQKVELKPKRRLVVTDDPQLAWRSSGEGGSSGLGGRTLDASLHSANAPPSRTSLGFGTNTVHNRRIKGRGLGVVATNRGVHKKVIFAPFGRFFLNLVKLDDDILCFSRKNGVNIPNLKTQRVSVDLAKVIRKLVNNGTPSFNDLSALSREDKNLYGDILKKCHIPSGEGIEVPRENSEDLNRFEIMKGEILSGNDSTVLIKEFKVMIIKLIHQGRLPKSQGKELLMDLAELGY